MYRLKEEYCNFFKEIRAIIYANYNGCNADYMSSILSGSRTCSELTAKSIISIKFDISIKNENMNKYLEKYFAKEK